MGVTAGGGGATLGATGAELTTLLPWSAPSGETELMPQSIDPLQSSGWAQRGSGLAEGGSGFVGGTTVRDPPPSVDPLSLSCAYSQHFLPTNSVTEAESSLQLLAWREEGLSVAKFRCVVVSVLSPGPSCYV